VCVRFSLLGLTPARPPRYESFPLPDDDDDDDSSTTSFSLSAPIMVRSNTFEIRWHDMQPIYSCSFQPIPPAHLRRVLDFNQLQGAQILHDMGSILTCNTLLLFSSIPAAGQDPSKLLAASNDTAKASSSRQAALPLNAQGQSWRFATAGGDNHARVSREEPHFDSHRMLTPTSHRFGLCTQISPRMLLLQLLRRAPLLIPHESSTGRHSRDTLE
jgi:hypothetical protein